jgi:hypothetical protein
MTFRPRSVSATALALIAALTGCAGEEKVTHAPAPHVAALPGVCPAEPAAQSPADLGAGGVAVAQAETCDVTGDDWVACHQHMHCGPEHAGAGICGNADCEVHTVYRHRKDGAHASAIADLHHGSVGGNCEPADHDLMVRATFVDFDAGCAASAPKHLTYCGSATGNNTIDADHDGAVSCAESGVNGVSVRWCIEAACECRPGGTPEGLAPELGEDEASRERGCPSHA